MSSAPGKNVCVVGSGALGLMALKNLREQGLNATAFTKDDTVGGLWRASEDKSKLTALKSTTLNTSAEVACATDFPMPPEYPSFPDQEQVDVYWSSYAKHFDLNRHINFSKSVISIRRAAKDTHWIVITQDVNTKEEETHEFDRVVMATGILNKPHFLKFKGQERFSGEIIHSREFKNPEKYKGKNVIVVGIGATGHDVLTFLHDAGAKKIWSSHRGQYFLMPRQSKGKAFDHSMSLRGLTILRFIGAYSASFLVGRLSKVMTASRDKAYPWLKDHPAVKGRPPAYLASQVPVPSQRLPELVREGKITDARGIEEITGPKSVRFSDGAEAEDVDAIICCSGYSYDMSVLQGKGDPTDPDYAPDGFQRFNEAKYYQEGQKFPRLFHGILSEQYPESLAILGHMIIMGPPFVTYDLSTMAIASLWSGAHPIPSHADITADINKHYNDTVTLLNKSTVAHIGFRFDSKRTFAFLNRAAGTGVVDKLANWSWAAWKFWWQDRKFYALLMNGVLSPAIYRLFKTEHGRKEWTGAREQIERTNKRVKEMGDKWQRENEEKSK